ncbi:hypothetical protein ABIB25_000859 [Nakamurella sp. UYEF19]
MTRDLIELAAWAALIHVGNLFRVVVPIRFR